jgi:hypothetical protein
MPVLSYFARQSQQRDTALIHASENYQTACLRLLVEAGADMDAKDNVRRINIIFCFFLIGCSCLFSRGLIVGAGVMQSLFAWTSVLYPRVIFSFHVCDCFHCDYFLH